MNGFVRWHFVLPTDKERFLARIAKISPSQICNLRLHLIGKSEILSFCCCCCCFFKLVDYGLFSTKETEIQL